MRLVFAGTPSFAAAALEALIVAGHDPVLVLTQPDRPAGRGMRPTPSDVKRVAEQRGLTLFQPVSLRGDDAVVRLRGVGADFMVVAAYGLILPASILSSFAGGCINIHASLLPRWRGAAPIQRALLAGDNETGISIMRMDEGLDTGPVYLQEALAIEPRETAGSLHDKLAVLGARCIVEALSGIAAGTLQPHPQPIAGATYAAKIDRGEAVLDWTASAEALDRSVRAFNPVPGAVTVLGEQTIKIWSAEPVRAGSGVAGEILRADGDGIVVRCGEDALCVSVLQAAGSKRMDAAQFLRGHALAAGQRFGRL